MPQPLTVILIENSFIIQAGIEQLLLEIPELVLTEVYDGSEKKLVEKIQQKKPDVVIISPNILNETVRSVANQLNKNGVFPVGLVDNNTPENLCSPFKLCLNINDDKYELLEILKNIAGNKTSEYAKKTIISELTNREVTILKQVVFGFTNQEIADKLFLSIHTVTTHRKNITRKLGIKTVSGLTVYALINKIVDLNEMEQK